VGFMNGEEKGLHLDKVGKEGITQLERAYKERIAQVTNHCPERGEKNRGRTWGKSRENPEKGGELLLRTENELSYLPEPCPRIEGGGLKPTAWETS